MQLFKFLTLGAALLPTILAAPRPPPKGMKWKPKPQHDTKYFHEPGIGDELGHYDVRYFKESVSYETRQFALDHLIRSYLVVFREKNIETWIAHGTLLGWWWNGKTMPWDWDLDTQVSINTLEWLGQNLNGTYYNYTLLTNDGNEEQREYFLDVNQNIGDRLRGDGQNVIDARWIDVQNGLFIDITGLAETNPSMQPGIWSCKNNHRYRTRDIYPLRETVFQGVPALVPYSFDRILTEEYSRRALTNTLHEGHQWLPDRKEWVKQSTPNQPPKNPQPPTQTGNEHNGKGHTQRSSLTTAEIHIPHSLLDANPKSGLMNLWKTL